MIQAHDMNKNYTIKGAGEMVKNDAICGLMRYPTKKVNKAE
jgi:hypothetical protein